MSARTYLQDHLLEVFAHCTSGQDPTRGSLRAIREPAHASPGGGLLARASDIPTAIAARGHQNLAHASLLLHKAGIARLEWAGERPAGRGQGIIVVPAARPHKTSSGKADRGLTRTHTDGRPAMLRVRLACEARVTFSLWPIAATPLTPIGLFA